MTEQKHVSAEEAASLDTCASEPIHVPGAVQPHGVLLAVDESTMNVTAVSENASSFFGVRPEKLMGRSIQSAFSMCDASADYFADLAAWLESVGEGPADYADLRFLGADGSRYRPLAHRQGTSVVIEMETDPDEPGLDVQRFLERSVGRLEAVDSIEELCRVAAEELKQLTAMDSVMVYRFDPEWNGTVVAQARTESMVSYLEHRFPSTDIPEQARRLYTINPSRLIPDVSYASVPILTREGGRAPLDLSFSALRSVSPIHIEYLKNMGVMASMSVSIVVDGTLWGLMACHHPEPNHVSVRRRSVSVLLTRIMAMLIGQLRAIESRTIDARRSAIHNRLLESMLTHDDFAQGLLAREDALLDLMDADGAAVVTAARCDTVGSTPSEEAIRRLAKWLQATGSAEPVHLTDNLEGEYEEGSALRDVASGLAAASLSKFNPSYVLWFRPELPHEVKWAGEPAKAVRLEDDGNMRIHPRKSFETWTSVVRGRSRPWQTEERAAADLLRSAVTDVVVSRSEEVRNLNDSLEEANEKLTQRLRELRDIADVTAHDLQEPLRKIRAFADLIEKEEKEHLSDDGKFYLSRLVAASTRMSRLISDLMSYSDVLVVERPLRPVDLSSTVREAVRELEMLGRREDAEIEIGDLPDLLGDESQFTRLFFNLIDNSIKFRHAGRTPRIVVRGKEASREPSSVQLTIEDNGIGVEDQYLERIFEPFNQLHGRGRYPGTGMGLAVCRRIVERHGGTIRAEKAEEVGLRIVVELPRPI